MTLAELKKIVSCDLYRVEGGKSVREFLNLLCEAPTFRCVFCFRLAQYLKRAGSWAWIPSKILSFIRKHQAIKYGIRIPTETQIGAGLYVGHEGGIWINGQAKLGENCNISQNVTIGGISRGAGKGAPTIGSQVYLGPGAVVSGGILVGSNALIGANSLVITDVPENGVFIGVPAKLFSKQGSGDYISHIPNENEPEQ